ncbi:MAG: J domain-containing protein [Proteobacteria bacterium]|nr:J domain-containing protein [Pseudomonadota bacterium]
MNPIYTHYENLKVTRNAPPEVIRAAYKTLSQKYHPDKNSNNADAARIMSIINVSYEILSDPHKRQEHDQWIARQELMDVPTGNVNTNVQQPLEVSVGFSDFFSHIFRNWLGYGVAAFVIWALTHTEPSTPPPEPKPYQITPVDAAEILGLQAQESHYPSPSLKPAPFYQATPDTLHIEYARPSAAPNDQPWPEFASYLKGYRRLHTDGLSTVTVDNSQNNSDVFVKLVSLSKAKAYPVRHFYIPAFSSFTLNKVKAGSYDIRYRDLGDGSLSRSETFYLVEVPIDNGIQFSNITMTLFKVQNGNMQTYALSEAEF